MGFVAIRDAIGFSAWLGGECLEVFGTGAGVKDNDTLTTIYVAARNELE
jgi:hypothetical protein